MEEYTQITMDQWISWKEDIRRKLAETASNFVYIGYRLKQIRDSGMYDGAADVFEFAKKEYGLGKSTVSRFIAINEKYSENGDSLELKEEFRQFSSSKLAEMLTLPDNEIQLITEKTTIREIRELKNFNTEENNQTVEMDPGSGRTPLEKCLVDFFKQRETMLNQIMKCLEEDPPKYKQAAEQMNPSGQSSHRKGILFLFLYDWNTGIKYKLMTEPNPINMGWPELLNEVFRIYGTCDRANVWKDFYGAEAVEIPKSEPVENTTLSKERLDSEEAIATSQQEAEEPEEKDKEGIEEDCSTRTNEEALIPKKEVEPEPKTEMLRSELEEKPTEVRAEEEDADASESTQEEEKQEEKKEEQPKAGAQQGTEKKRDVQAYAYNKDVLKSLICDEEEQLKQLGEHWMKYQPLQYIKHMMILEALRMLWAAREEEVLQDG